MVPQAQSFTILGCSSGHPQPGRGTSSYLLTIGNSLTVIDCGSGSVPTFLKYNFDPRQIDRIFISHTHSDHVADLTLFIQMIYLTGRENPLTIYLPAEFEPIFQKYLRAVYLVPERFPFEIIIRPYEAGFVFNDTFELRAIGNNHLGKMAGVVKELGLPNQCHCCSFSIRMPDGGKSLLYSADLGSFNDIQAHIVGHNYAIIESTHVEIDELIEFTRTSDVEKFVVTHLGSDGEIEEIRRKIDESGLRNIDIAHEGMTLL